MRCSRLFRPCVNSRVNKGKKIVLNEADHVVVIASSRPVNTLKLKVKELGISVCMISDSEQIRNDQHVILEGYIAGYKI